MGAVARFWLSGIVGRAIGETFPWGTLVVNVTGSIAIGAGARILPIPGAGVAPSILWLACVTGFLGGYTTVSSFSLQSLNLVRVGEWPSAAGNAAGSVLLCLFGAAAGFAAAAVLAS